MRFVDLLVPFFSTLSPLRVFLAPEKQDEDMTTILGTFLRDHDMISTNYPSVSPTNKELEARMQEYIESHGLSIGQANQIVALDLAASLIELGYHGCTFDEKLNIALINWYLLYIDNESPKDITPYIAFEERFLRNLPQLDPLLNGLASCLHTMFDLYPISFANSIINASLDFILGTCTEPSMEKIELPTTITLLPWFFRHQTSVAVAYASMLFPKSRQIDYVDFFQALADMEFWIAASNDLLSYYKESMAGETANYVSNRAIVEARAPLKVLSDIRKELLNSRNHIYTTLTKTAGQEAVKIWRALEHGYITWHLQQERYRLQELQLELRLGVKLQ